MPVKVDAEVLKMARIVASFEDTTIAELISEILRPELKRRLDEHATEQLHQPKPDKKPKP